MYINGSSISYSSINALSYITNYNTYAHTEEQKLFQGLYDTANKIDFMSVSNQVSITAQKATAYCFLAAISIGIIGIISMYLFNLAGLTKKLSEVFNFKESSQVNSIWQKIRKYFGNDPKDDEVIIAMDGFTPEQVDVITRVVRLNRKLIKDFDEIGNILNDYTLVDGFPEILKTCPEQRDIIEFCNEFFAEMGHIRAYVGEFSNVDTKYVETIKPYESLLYDTEGSFYGMDVLGRFRETLTVYVVKLYKLCSLGVDFRPSVINDNGRANIPDSFTDEEKALFVNVFKKLDIYNQNVNLLKEILLECFYGNGPRMDRYINWEMYKEGDWLIFETCQYGEHALPGLLENGTQILNKPHIRSLYTQEGLDTITNVLPLINEQVHLGLKHFEKPNILGLNELQYNIFYFHDLMRCLAQPSKFYTPEAQAASAKYLRWLCTPPPRQQLIAFNHEEEVLLMFIRDVHNFAGHMGTHLPYQQNVTRLLDLRLLSMEMSYQYTYICGGEEYVLQGFGAHLPELMASPEGHGFEFGFARGNAKLLTNETFYEFVFGFPNVYFNEMTNWSVY